ncbi:hypothetical protein RFI_14811 [Reticulomyxa filosa]|uniref:Uncharacterized protein n=1 Tax=Reticulomyxa filosa TaxID=46433 RepID=X6N934_RETFI|nr:hypothetical protein RFI_14811 [Reticulomyxa filosa]|eukprot:ETO22388.1 hypothetical protein RFI_14811 [Reticulomyxa filosa]
MNSMFAMFLRKWNCYVKKLYIFICNFKKLLDELKKFMYTTKLSRIPREICLYERKASEKSKNLVFCITNYIELTPMLGWGVKCKIGSDGTSQSPFAVQWSESGISVQLKEITVNNQERFSVDNLDPFGRIEMSFEVHINSSAIVQLPVDCATCFIWTWDDGNGNIWNSAEQLLPVLASTVKSPVVLFPEDTGYTVNVQVVWPSIRTIHLHYCPDQRSGTWFFQPNTKYTLSMTIQDPLLLFQEFLHFFFFFLIEKERKGGGRGSTFPQLLNLSMDNLPILTDCSVSNLASLHPLDNFTFSCTPANQATWKFNALHGGYCFCYFVFVFGFFFFFFWF